MAARAERVKVRHRGICVLLLVGDRLMTVPYRCMPNDLQMYYEFAHLRDHFGTMRTPLRTLTRGKELIWYTHYPT